MTRAVLLIVFCALLPLGALHAGELEVPTACDLLAAHPSDPDKIVEGVSAETVRPALDTAIAACRLDVERHPEQARLVYYLGRVLFYAGQFQEGMQFVDRAAAMGHRQSQFVSALIYFDGVPEAIAADPCRAMSLWQDAASRGHYAASQTLARHALGGRFADCGEVPSRAEMRSWVEAAAAQPQAGDFYHGLLNGLLLELLHDERS
jgi:TPR repeat protein